MKRLDSGKRILVTGATGLVGRALSARLVEEGARLVVAGRKPEAKFRTEFSLPCEYHLWAHPMREPPPRAAFEVAAVVHLMGEPVAARRWTNTQKRTILESRTLSTRLLAAALRAQNPHLETFVSASAIGFYGDAGESELTEASPPGNDFLARVCREWEREATTAPGRVVFMRTGMVLARDGGALAKLLPLFRAGLGGRLGSGRQWVSWIHIDDLVAAYLAALTHPELRGPVNAVAPAPLRNHEFTAELARVVGRPAFLPAPAWALRLALGELSGMLLGGQKVAPMALKEEGFFFRYPTLAAALGALMPPRG